MRKIKQALFVLLLIVTWAASNSLQAQEQNITGTITSRMDGKPISDVKIRIKGALEIGAVSDARGNYNIIVGLNTIGELIFMHPDFDIMEVPIDGRFRIDVAMEPKIRVNPYGQIVNRVPLEGEERNGMLFFESRDQSYRTWFDLRVNFDGAHYFDKNALNELGSGLAIRRLRFAMKTVLYRHWTGEVDLDFSGGQLDTKDAFVGYRSDKHRYYFKAGYFKEPLSNETTTTSRFQTFIEEPYMTEFAPARQIGVNFSKWGPLYLGVIGIHFNDVENLEVTTYTENANKDRGTDEGYSITAKGVIKPVNIGDKVVHIAAAGSYRTPKTSWEFPNTFRISTRDMTNINRKKYLDTDDIPNVESQVLLGGEFAVGYNNFKLASEYMYTKINRTSEFKSYQASGMFASVSCLLFGGNYNYNDEEGEFTQVTRGKNWGDIELAFRFDYMNLNDFDANILGGSANGYTGGITYHVNFNVKMMLNYSYIDHDRYANGKGKLFVGTDANGNKTTDYKKVTESAGKAGDDYGFIQARIEVDF